MTNEKMLKVINDYMRDSDITTLFTAKQQLEEDVRAEIQKSKGNASKDKLIKTMFKKSKNDKFANGYSVFKNQFAFTDSFRAYVLNEDFGYQKLDNELNFEPFRQHGDIEIEIDTNDVKFYIKQCKSESKDLVKNPYVIHTEEFDIGFNAQYLFEFAQMFGEKAFIKKNVAPMYSENDKGEWGVLVPVRLKK